MALDTYTNLQTAIGNWLNRGDLTAAIPDFITVAETQMLRRFKRAMNDGYMLPRSMVVNNNAFTISSEYADVPADFMGGVVSFNIDPQTIGGQTYGAVQLDYLSPQNLVYLKQRRGTSPTSMIPGVYSIVGTKFQFLPVPDQSYTGNLWYWQKFTALSNSNAANWILTNHPDVYLYGALTASAPYLMDDARVQTWVALFTAAMDDLIKSDPLPSDRSWLRVDAALTYRPNSMSGFNIQTGEFQY